MKKGTAPSHTPPYTMRPLASRIKSSNMSVMSLFGWWMVHTCGAGGRAGEEGGGAQGRDHWQALFCVCGLFFGHPVQPATRAGGAGWLAGSWRFAGKSGDTPGPGGKKKGTPTPRQQRPARPGELCAPPPPPPPQPSPLTTVRCRRASATSVSMSVSAISLSRPLVGSSKKMTRGSYREGRGGGRGGGGAGGRGAGGWGGGGGGE